MALKIYDEFAPRANPGDTNYPDGSIKNESAPGAKDGTPLDANWGNDYAGGDAALFAETGITPSGNPDTVLISQRLDALKLLHINDISKSYTFKTVVLMKASTISFPVGKKIFWQGYHVESDGGGNWGIVKSGVHTEDGGSILTLSNGDYIEANMKSSSVNVLKFGVQRNNGVDQSTRIQVVFDYVASFIEVVSIVDNRNGMETKFPNGSYTVSDSMRLYGNNLTIKGTGGVTFVVKDFIDDQSSPAVFIVGSAEDWLSGSISSTRKYNQISDIKISRKDSMISPIGIMLTGTRNASLTNILCEQVYCGVWMENTSECSTRQFSAIGCNYGAILDSRNTRSTGESPLGVANTDNDVSANTFNQFTAYYPQNTGMLFVDVGSTSVYGATIGRFSENPASPKYNLPNKSVGIHISGSNTNFTRGSLFDDVVFEPIPSSSKLCVLITSQYQNNPVRGVTLRNLHSQTWAADYAGGNVTTMLAVEAYNGGWVDAITMKDSGFTVATSGFDYPRLVDQSLASNVGSAVTDMSVKLENCYPTVAYSSSNIGASRINNIEYIEQTVIDGAIPTGWAATSGSNVTVTTGANGVENSLYMTGNGGVVSAMSKTFSYKPFLARLGAPHVSLWYKGDTAPHINLIVNGDITTARVTKSGTNSGRYSTALQDAPISSVWRRAVYMFRPFSAGYGFQDLTIELGRVANGNGNFTEIKGIEVGFSTIKEMPYNPF